MSPLCVVSCVTIFYFQSISVADTLCLLIGGFSPLIFNVIIDRARLKSIMLLFVFCLYPRCLFTGTSFPAFIVVLCVLGFRFNSHNGLVALYAAFFLVGAREITNF